MKKAVLPLILVFLFTFMATIANGETAIDLYNLGNKYGVRGKSQGIREDFERAIKCYNIAVSLDPTYGSGYAGRGYCYAKLGKLDEAIKDSATGCNLGSKTGCDNYNIYIKQK